MEWEEIHKKLKEDYYLLPKNWLLRFLAATVPVLGAMGLFGWEAIKYATQNTTIKKYESGAQQAYERIVQIKNSTENEWDAIPVGTIMAWHKNMSKVDGEKIEVELPKGWVECNGQQIKDKESPLDYVITPNLNEEALFLRGSQVSGEIQKQQWKRLSVETKQLQGGKDNRDFFHKEQIIPETGTTELPVYGGTWGAGDPSGMIWIYKEGEVRPKICQ